MPNAWVMHVKKWSAANNKAYGCAVSDPDCRASYKKPVKIKPLTKKQQIKEREYEANEMQMMEQEEKKQRQEEKKKAQLKKDKENETMKKYLKEQEEMAKYYEEEQEKERNNQLYLSEFLDIKIVKKERGITPDEMKYFNKMFNLINNYFKTGDVLKMLEKVNFTYNAQEYIINWLTKKNNVGSAELSDFIKRVVFPRLKKDNSSIDNITLILESISISVELKKMIDDEGESQFNSFRIVNAFFDHKISNVWVELKNKIPGLKQAREEYLNYLEGPFSGRNRKL